MMKKAAYIKIILLALLALCGEKLAAQSCQGTVPQYNVDLSAAPDDVWNSNSVQRNGRCCGLNNTYRCIHFTVTLHSKAAGIRISVSGTTTGYTYERNCAGSIAVNDTMCLTGPGPHEITICRTGVSANQVYTIRSIPKIEASADIYAFTAACTPAMTVQHLVQSTIRWQSLGNNATYNSYLSCQTGCNSTTITIPSTSPVAYIDYVVSGYSQAGCDTSRQYDTVRVYTAYKQVNAGADTSICSAANFALLNGTVGYGTSQGWTGQGGRFIPSSTALNARYVPSLTEVTAGSTYLVLTSRVSASCFIRDTIRINIYSAPVPVITGAMQVCSYSTNKLYSVTPVAGHSYDWHIVGGKIRAGQATSEISVDWDSAGPGYIYMVQTDANGCQGVGAIQTISRFDFNSSPLTTATTGPNALSVDADVYSDGFGFVVTDNCGGTKGIDLVVPGSVFNRGKMCMTYSWQRDENQADFFTRGGLAFRIDAGGLQIQMRVQDGFGGFVDIGPLNTGYTIPNDDMHRYFTFCYDSVSGMARVMVHDSLVWSYNGTPGRSLYWTGAGNANIGNVMDGSCSGNTLLDWSNISIPISIVPRPVATMSGPASVCQYKTGTYTATGPAYYKYTWSANGGIIQSGQGTTSAVVKWTTSGTRQVSVTALDTTTMCDSIITRNVTVVPAPNTAITGRDTICKGSQYIYVGTPGASRTYLWSSTTAAFAGGTANDSSWVTFSQIGSHNLTLRITDNVTGCDSTVTKTIYVDSLPALVVTGANPVCRTATPQPYQATNSSTYSYAWTLTGGTVASGAGTSSITANWPTTGSKNVRVTITRTSSGCQRIINYPVTVYPTPVLGSILYH